MRIRAPLALVLAGCAAACSSNKPVEQVKPAHSLGGTATNLHGAGLLLKSGLDAITVEKEGTFTFPTKIQEGKQYTVTLESQPSHPNQDCTLTGGTGTMGTNDVTSVQINCVTKNYFIGGTVSGLNGTLGLQVAEGNAITVHADGRFDFPNPLPDGSAFDVAITQSPPNQICTATPTSARIKGGDFLAVRVNCVDTLTVGGVLRGASGPIEVRLNGKPITLQENGPFTLPGNFVTDDTYSVFVTLPPQGQECAVNHGSGVFGTENVSNVVIDCARWYDFRTNPAASFVFGQPDFESGKANQGGTVSAETLNHPWGLMGAAGGNFFVPDSGNNRILVFADVPQTANGTPSHVLGQADFKSSAEATTQTGLKAPEALATDGTRLFVADSGNDRVLIYNDVTLSNDTTPSSVVGKSSFTSTVTGCGQDLLQTPEAVFAFGGRLLVSDTNNNRVLIWNELPTTDGKPADLVLGQQRFDSCVINDVDDDGNEHTTPNGSTMSGPTGIWTDGERLIVSDTGNHRLLVWNSFPTSNGQAADLVLGQQDFLSNAVESTSAATLNFPWTVMFTGLQLFVVDNGNNRVLIWNSFPTQTGQAADAVVGQPDTDSGIKNNDGTGTSSINAAGLFSPGGLLLYGNQLWVLDTGNNRLLAYDSF